MKITFKVIDPEQYDCAGYTKVVEVEIGLLESDSNLVKLDRFCHEVGETFIMQDPWRWKGDHELMNEMATYFAFVFDKIGFKLDKLPTELEV